MTNFNSSPHRASSGLLFLVATVTITACSMPGSNQFGATQAQPVNVDRYIDGRLPLHDQQVMARVMQNLAPSQIGGDVVFFDADGRVYANNPEALARAFKYRAVGPNSWAAPDGEEITTPDNGMHDLAARNQLQPATSCPNPPQNSGGTGPFYRIYNGGAPSGYNFRWGCFSAPYASNLIFTVSTPTLLSGTFAGFVDKRQYPGPKPPPFKMVTLAQAVSPGDGWNTSGNGETTFTNTQIAQKPEKLNSLSHFAVLFFMNGTGSIAGTGTYQKAITGCAVENPAQYDGGPSGPCTGWAIVFPAVHPYPTPPPNSAFFINAIGQNGLLEVDACLANSICDQVPLFQRQ